MKIFLKFITKTYQRFWISLTFFITMLPWIIFIFMLGYYNGIYAVFYLYKGLSVILLCMEVVVFSSIWGGLGVGSKENPGFLYKFYEYLYNYSRKNKS